MYKSSQDDSQYDDVAVKPTKYTRVFIGRSPVNKMTKFSGGHGPKFDGNSMLFELGETSYMFVGECVRTFTTRSPITTFVSPVGNSDVPYPYAIDAEGTVYLLIENVKLTAVPDSDPYDFYYKRGLLTPDLGLGGEPVEPFEGITAFYIGAKQYTFRYEPDPERDFERLSHFGRDKKLVTPLYVVAHGVKRKLGKKDYVDLMRRVGKQRGFARLKSSLW